MSETDLIGELYDAIASGNPAAVSERMHPDVVWKHNIGVGTLEEGEYRGRQSVIALFERILEPWEYMHVKPREVRDLGEGVFLVTGELEAKHRSVATEIATPYEQRLEFRDGLLARGEMVSGADAHLP